MEIPRYWRLKLYKDDGNEKNPVRKRGMKMAIAKSVEDIRQSLEDTRVRIMVYEAQPIKYESLEDIKI